MERGAAHARSSCHGAADAMRALPGAPRTMRAAACLAAVQVRRWRCSLEAATVLQERPGR
jgi:hypothetical protein